MTHRQSVHDLKSLVRSFHSLIAIETVEEERVEDLLSELANELGQPLFEWSVTTGFRRRGTTLPVGNTYDALAVLKHIHELRVDAIFLLKDLGPHLQKPETCRALREVTRKMAHTSSAIVVTGEPLELPREIDAVAVRFELKLPDENERREVVRQVVESMQQRQPVEMDLTREDVQRLIHALSGLTLRQTRSVIAQAILDTGKLAPMDIEHVIRLKGEIIERGGILEFFPAEENQYELGGFARLKAWLEDARIGFTDEAKAVNLQPPKGVLFVGVQGCGKSLAAKFIARSWQMPLLKLDAGRLYDKYVGESEKNFRRVTAVAESMAPVVLWIDEIEKAFASVTASDADGGLSQRLFASFLTWLQEKKEGVFVVGAANDVGRMPPELLRKGRFDEIFFVDLPSAEERKTIAAIHLKLRKQNAQAFDLARIAAASEGFSGAEIEQAVIASLYRALHAKQSLTTERVVDAMRGTVPLSVARREDVERLREFAAGRFTPVA
ncbi:MAG TPA: AAA family ATPase [Thermoanaerobaculia bacterium]|nr:AAA family ATPase [Thermoanaerobaculia bacterium]